MENQPNLTLTPEGFLMDYRLWNSELALKLAEHSHLVLSENHWEILHVLRDFYEEYQHIPPSRILMKRIFETLGKEKASTLYFCRLFPNEPLKTACKVAGLPKPRHCL